MGIRYPLVGLNYVPDTSEMRKDFRHSFVLVKILTDTQMPLDWTATRDLLLEHIHGHIMQPHQV